MGAFPADKYASGYAPSLHGCCCFHTNRLPVKDNYGKPEKQNVICCSVGVHALGLPIPFGCTTKRLGCTV